MGSETWPEGSTAPANELMAGVVRAVGSEMRGQPASMVYEVLDLTLARRLPGIPVDDEALRQTAAKISIGVL